MACVCKGRREVEGEGWSGGKRGMDFKTGKSTSSGFS